jgi:hypothetical protein
MGNSADCRLVVIQLKVVLLTLFLEIYSYNGPTMLPHYCNFVCLLYLLNVVLVHYQRVE